MCDKCKLYNQLNGRMWSNCMLKISDYYNSLFIVIFPLLSVKCAISSECSRKVVSSFHIMIDLWLFYEIYYSSANDVLQSVKYH